MVQGLGSKVQGLRATLFRIQGFGSLAVMGFLGRVHHGWFVGKDGMTAHDCAWFGI